MECSNRVRDKLNPDPSNDQVKKAEAEMLKCAENCIDSQLSTSIPAMVSRLKDQLQKLKAEQLKLTN